MFGKHKGFSQEDLATRVKVSRSSLAQIELGNRGLEILELQKLSQVLGFSLDDFMSKDFSVEEDADLKEEPGEKAEVRVIGLLRLLVIIRTRICPGWLQKKGRRLIMSWCFTEKRLFLFGIMRRKWRGDGV